MKKFIVSAIILVSRIGIGNAQNNPPNPFYPQFQVGTGVPPSLTCSNGNLFYNVNQYLWYTCGPNNVWATLGANSGAVGYIVYNGPDLATACNIAVAANKTLVITEAILAIPNTTCNANVEFFTGGSIQPASGQTVTLKLQSAPLTTICDISISGTCAITSSTGFVYPEWAGAVSTPTSTATFPTQDSKPAFDWACTQVQPIQLQSALYKYNGKMTCLTNSTGKTIIGGGSANTVVFFSDATQTAAIEISGSGTTNHLILQGWSVEGPGIAAGSMYGFYSHGGNGNNNGYTFQDMQFLNFSQDCLNSSDAFMTRFYDTYEGNCGGNGKVLMGDQSPTLINSGHYSYNIIGYCLWVKDGAPFIQGYNCGNGTLGGGAHFGANMSVISLPVIMSMNIEGVTTAGGEGITFEQNSNFGFVAANGLQLYANAAGLGPAIHWKGVGQAGLMINLPRLFSDTANVWPTPAFVADGCSTNDGMFIFGLGQSIASISNTTFQGCTYQWIANGNGFMQSSQPLSTLSSAAVTAASNAASSNTQLTTITSPSLTTAAGGSYAIAFSNTMVGTGSRITCSAYLVGSTTGMPYATCVPGVQVVTIALNNISASAAAFNGTVAVTVSVW